MFESSTIHSRNFLLAVAITTACVIGACEGAPSFDAGHVDRVTSAAVIPSSRMAVSDYFAERFGLSLSNVYWGDFHAHSSYSLDAAVIGRTDVDDVYSPAEAYAYARDVEEFDFVGLSDHPEEPNVVAMPWAHRLASLDLWQSQLAMAREYNDEDDSDGHAFIVFAGWEYTNTFGCVEMGRDCGSATGYGHKNVLFSNLDAADLPATRYGAGGLMKKEDVATTAADLWDRLAAYRPPYDGCPGKAMTSPHTPAMKGASSTEDHRTDWRAMDGDFVRTVEIYSKWGSAEGPAPSTCATLDPPFEYDAERSSSADTVRTQLNEHWVRNGDHRFKLGFVGGTDDHHGRPGNADWPTMLGRMKYRGAITGIIAPTLSREDLWNGLWSRHSVATTTSANHERLPVLFAVQSNNEDLLMGDSGDSGAEVRIRVLAGPAAKKIEIVVDGCKVATIADTFADATLQLGPGHHYIYARVLDTSSAEPLVTWASPVYLENVTP